MRRYFTFFSFLVAFAVTTHAQEQVHSISTGPNYSKQSFFNLSTGEEFQLDNEAWDIAFSNVSSTDVGVFINESFSSASTGLKLFLAPTTNWDDQYTDLSIFTDSLILYNRELNWTLGAFNHVATPGNPFDFGWGTYNPQNHVVEGSRIFVLEGRDGNFKKIQIENFKSGAYNFKYANLDGSDEQTKTITKSTDLGAIIFFSLSSGEIVPTPKNYDLMFLRYYTPLDAGGEILEYVVTGVLTAPGVESVNVKGIDPATVNEQDYQDDYVSLPTNIGHKWKAFDFSLGWVIAKDQAFFVKTQNKDIYKIVFLDFEGTQTGTAYFESTFVKKISSSSDVALPVDISVFPNPTNNLITIATEETENIKVDMFTVNGQLIQSLETQTNHPFDVSRYNYKGLMALRITMGGKVLVKHIAVN